MEKTLQVHPSDSSALTLAGLYYYSTNRADKAEEKFRSNVQAHPKSLSANAGYMEFLMYAQKWEELSSESRKAFERFPQVLDFVEMSILADHYLERYDDVIDLCDCIISSEHADTSAIVNAWTTKGDAYYELKDSKKAFKSYDKALKLDPDKVNVLNNYAYFLCEQGKKLKKACEMSAKTIAAEPDNATYLDTYGWILYCLGRPQDAKPHFKRAMLYGGKESPVILDHYAEVLFALGEYTMARVYWDKALLINNGEVPDLEERVQRRKQQMKKD
jgi:Tfp pilus assembly protein PilF